MENVDDELCRIKGLLQAALETVEKAIPLDQTEEEFVNTIEHLDDLVYSISGVNHKIRNKVLYYPQ